MQIFVQDTNIVAETEAQLVEFLQQGPIAQLMFLSNDGVNTMNYRFEYYSGTAWVAMGAVGSDYYNTLISGQSRAISVSSAYPRIRIMGNASGGAILNFTVSRQFTRSSGGSCPILAM